MVEFVAPGPPGIDGDRVEADCGYLRDKRGLVVRLRRIAGQVRGIERMIEDERYCVDVLTQLGAVSTALDAVAVKVLGDHVAVCVGQALSAGDHERATQKQTELMDAVERFLRMH